MRRGSEVVAVAQWEVPPTHLEDVLGLLQLHAAATRAEPGCLGFEITQGSEPAQLVLLERYADEAALAAHRDTEHFKTYVLEQMVPHLSSRSITLLNPLHDEEERDE